MTVRDRLVPYRFESDLYNSLPFAIYVFREDHSVMLLRTEIAVVAVAAFVCGLAGARLTVAAPASNADDCRRCAIDFEDAAVKRRLDRTPTHARVSPGTVPQPDFVRPASASHDVATDDTNTCRGCSSRSGDDTARNKQNVFVGKRGTGNVQKGDNKARVRQDADAESGDGVSGQKMTVSDDEER